MYNLIVDKLLSNTIFFESVKYARMNFVLRSNRFMAIIASLSSCYFTALYYESFVKKKASARKHETPYVRISLLK